MEILLGKSDTQVNIDAHLYEINKEKLTKIYNHKPTKSYKFEIVEKKVLFSHDEKDSPSNFEKHYYSNFKFFKEYLTTGFKSEETKGEISECKKLIQTAKSLRERLKRLYKLPNETQTFDQTNSEITSSSHTSIFQPKKNYFKQMVKLCKLLTLKPEKENEDIKPEFKLFSELTNPSDVFSFAVNENFLENKLLSLQKKLTSGYYQEEFFNNFALNYFNNNQGLTDTTMGIHSDLRKKIPVEYIDAIFALRGADSFYQIDSFMSNYEVKKTHSSDKDLYENIYSILSKSNYNNFMSFLYSKNPLFKFVYDEFALKKANFDALENAGLSRIDSVETDRFFRGSDILTSPKNKIMINPARRGTIRSLKDNINVDDYLACFYVDKISFLNEKIDENIVELLIADDEKSKNKNEKSENVTGNDKVYFRNRTSSDFTVVSNILKALTNKDFSYIMLINKHERIKILNYNDEDLLSNNYNSGNFKEIDEDCKNIKLHKINIENLVKRVPFLSGVIKDNFAYSNSDEKFFFILEIKKIVIRKVSEAKFSLSQNEGISTFYFFRINNDYIKRFEMTINHLKLFDNFETRNKTEVVSSFRENRSNAFGKKSILVDDLKDKLKVEVVNDDKQSRKLSENNDHLDSEIELSQDNMQLPVINNKLGGIKKKDYSNNQSSSFEETDTQAFKSKIKEESSKKDNYNTANFLEFEKDSGFGSNEINFKGFSFEVQSKQQYSFKDEAGKVILNYSNLEGTKGQKNYSFEISEFRYYTISAKDLKNYFEGTVKLNYKDKASNVEFVFYDKMEYNLFVKKIDSYLPKA